MVNMEFVLNAFKKSSMEPLVVEDDTAGSKTPKSNMPLLKNLLALNLSILIFVGLPLVLPAAYFSEPWFALGDLIRLADPLITLPLFFFVLRRANLLEKSGHCQNSLLLAFMVCAAVYVEGHAMHLSAAMFKHSVEFVVTTYPDSAIQYPMLPLIYSYMRDRWEHIYGHYMYAFGALGMSVVHMLAYKDQVHPRLDTFKEKIFFFAASSIFGLVFGGIAINFPAGLIVGPLWIVLYALPWTCLMWSKRTENDRIFKTFKWDTQWQIFSGDRELWALGRRLVIQHYLFAYVVALFVIVLFLCIFGFKIEAGVA